MAEMLVQSENLASIADAIRSKGNTAEALRFPDGFISAIADITTGVELNFVVVGGTSEPTNPEENTIWVNTPDKITGYAFSPTEPAEPVEGLVWILTGTSSTVAFNALKKNGIQIYPISARQYISGVLVYLDGYIYQNGKCTQFSKAFDGYLFRNGAWSEVTCPNGAAKITGAGNVKIDDNGYLHLTYNIILGINDMIDLTEWESITVTIPSRYSAGFSIIVLNSYEEEVAKFSDSVKSETGTYSLSIKDITGKCYIRIQGFVSSTNDGQNVKFSEIKLA